MRITDAEREQVADRLRDAGADGRLDPVELDERLTAAFRAKRWADITRLLKDL